MSKAHEFPRDVVFPSYFINALQEIVSAGRLDFRLSRKSATTIRVVPDPAFGLAGINIQGRYRWNTATVERIHPGGAKGTYTIWATAEDDDIDDEPKTNTDHTVRTFDLAITNGADPAAAIFVKVGELDWSGAAIEALRQTYAPTTGPMIAEGALSNAGDLEWKRDADGFLVPSYKDDSVGTVEIAPKAVTAAEMADALKPSAGAAAGTEALRALGVTASTAAAGNDARLSDTRTPTDGTVAAPKFAALPGARVKRSGASQKVTSRGSFKPVLFDAEDWDNGGMHSLVANTSRLTCVTPGVYVIHGMAQFSGPASKSSTSEAAKGDRVAALVKNGDAGKGPVPGFNLVELSVAGRTPDPTLPGSGGNALAISAPCILQVGDYVELWVWQNSEEELSILSGDGLHEPFLSAVFQHAP